MLCFRKKRCLSRRNLSENILMFWYGIFYRNVFKKQTKLQTDDSYLLLLISVSSEYSSLSDKLRKASA